MLRSPISKVRATLTLAAAIFLLAPQDAGWATATATDDTALFSTAVPPNVVLILDNSGSMNHAVWQPAFMAFDPVPNFVLYDPAEPGG